jgi:alanine dehydrogenase
MDVCILKETRAREHRVALTPSGAKALVQQGHRVWLEAGAGADAGHADAAYQSAGVSIAYSRGEALGRGELLVGVFPPEPREYELLRPGQVVFAFWALPAARPEDLAALMARRVTAVGLEIIEDDQGCAPVLTSMSEIAGGLAVTIGAGLLLNDFGGKGILLGGAPAVPPAHLVILGAGVLGSSAARAAAGIGAQVTVLDSNLEKLRRLARELGGRVITMFSTRPNVEKALAYADLVLGAVAVRGDRAPVLVTRDMLALMKPRSVVLDLSIDMGGCFETARPTAMPNAVYEVDGILHCCVPNLPSLAARASTQALTNSLLPYLLGVAGAGFEAAAATLPELGRGTYLYRGRACRESLARAFRVPCERLERLVQE